MKREGYVIKPAPDSPAAKAEERASQLAIAAHLNALAAKPKPAA